MRGPTARRFSWRRGYNRHFQTANKQVLVCVGVGEGWVCELGINSTIHGTNNEAPVNKTDSTADKTLSRAYAVTSFYYIA